MTKFERYSIVYSPPKNSKLAALGASWFAHHPPKTPNSSPLNNFGLPPEFKQSINHHADRQGFNAILQAPFHARAGVTAKELVEGLKIFCRHQRCIKTGIMKLSAASNQLVIEPMIEESSIRQLSSDCIRFFTPYREPILEIAINPKLKDILNKRQLNYFINWGYPYVFEEYAFRIALTGPIPTNIALKLANHLKPNFDPLLYRGLSIAELTLLGHPPEKKPSVEIKRIPLKNTLAIKPQNDQKTIEQAMVNPHTPH